MVESKASGKSYHDDEIKGPKLYHAECYDDAHELFEYNREYLENILNDPEGGRWEIEEIFWEFEMDAPPGLSDDELIDMILELEEEWVRNNHNT
jgi:hypothetical protein